MKATGFKDRSTGYGLVTRILHWVMAVLFMWQLMTVVFRVFSEDSAIDAFFWGTHQSVGTLIWMLAILRGLWGIANLRERRHGVRTFLSTLASCGHLTLYLFMIVVPSLALLRSMGAGRGVNVFGLNVAPAEGFQNETWTSLGNIAHGLSGWVLFALIAGHIAMALIHQWILRDNLLSKMTIRRTRKFVQPV